MLALSLLILGLLSAVAPASCQQGLGNLQPWMQGLIAVAVFLVLVAIVFAVNHFWCQEEPEPGSMVMIVGNKADGVLVGMDGRYSSMASGFRSSEHKNAFENVLEEEGRVRSTPM
ncbi:PDZK1-interacting protein 1 [Peromyscus californicus insignis]|uniref:PDZK1-interacting protein 1 n=1 Tax=Peromyscus californicus insignis TaxID=564181 RepID=UPI0022A7656A|nr:PDZK1-interacting protein 1 [Peromyscus californicus insignis]XP_052574257.1 PDZK1-interacting protein 1 [Peromyscus californicus insignis]XP_052574258.1 PDZK1-interacting protein 1 [Peromyscus californicus insignis]